jgi:ribosomal protein L11 methylase PrmA
LVSDLIQPKSVVDVGCGLGTWLTAFNKEGVEDILGIDGEYVDRRMLKISLERIFGS